MTATKCVHVCWILVGASTRKAFRGSVDWLAPVVRWGRSFGQSWAWSGVLSFSFFWKKSCWIELWTDLNNGFHLWWRTMEVSTSFTTTTKNYVEHLQNTISHKIFPRELPSKVFPAGLFETWLLAHAQFWQLYVCDELLVQSSQESLTNKSPKTQWHWYETKLVLFQYILCPSNRHAYDRRNPYRRPSALGVPSKHR